MRYSITIDNIISKSWGLNIQQAYLFSWIYSLPSWADQITFESQTYYFASKNKVIEELPLLSDKIDTIYRLYKQLEKKQLIKIIKVSGKDYIMLTKKAKEWNCKSEHSEKNPNEFGKKSENNSEKNPTNNNYNNNIITTRDKAKDKSKQFYNLELEKSKLFEYHKQYKELVSFMFGNNDFKQALSNVLAFPNGLTYEQLEKLLQRKGNASIMDVLEEMENNPDKIKGKKYLYKTLLNWINIRNNAKW